MSPEILSFSLPKIGEAEKNIQDKFASSSDGSLAALADGAGSSLYPGKWAEILVTAFCESSQTDPIKSIQQSYEEWLKPCQEEWRQYYLAQLRNPSRQWWQGGSQLKDRGSSTFIGLHLQNGQNSQPQQWQTVAVGDTCLFILERNTQTLLACPLTTSQAFKGTTPCFASLPEYPSSPPQFEEGWYEVGDTFLLATDALAQWLLRDYENQGQAWKALFEIKEFEEFTRMIGQLRQEKLIKNDDTTMIVIRNRETIIE